MSVFDPRPEQKWKPHATKINGFKCRIRWIVRFIVSLSVFFNSFWMSETVLFMRQHTHLLISYARTQPHTLSTVRIRIHFHKLCVRTVCGWPQQMDKNNICIDYSIYLILCVTAFHRKQEEIVFVHSFINGIYCESVTIIGSIQVRFSFHQFNSAFSLFNVIIDWSVVAISISLTPKWNVLELNVKKNMKNVWFALKLE